MFNMMKSGREKSQIKRIISKRQFFGIADNEFHRLTPQSLFCQLQKVFGNIKPNYLLCATV